ncbi:MAG: hypothetical protein L3J04_03185 [Robiginitomaculum sp.]|nr:hypothetical protein [Robiginitomaculum sp.]
MKIVKGLTALAVILVIIGFAVWQYWAKDMLVNIQVATAYTAKNICSCRFVTERELQSCFSDFTDDISSLKITEKSNEIISKAPLGLSVSKAKYASGIGCSLVK